MDVDAEFRAWAEQARAGLQRTAFMLCTDWALSEDIAQEALLKVYLRWRRIRTNPTAYARRAVSTTFVDFTRKSWRRETSTEELPEQPVYLPDGTLAAPVLQALKRVPDGQRTVLVLRFWEDMTMPEIAKVLGCSVGNAKSQASRGLERLRTELAAMGVTADILEGT